MPEPILTGTFAAVLGAVLVASVAAVVMLGLMRILRVPGARGVNGLREYSAGGWFATWFTPALVILGAEQDDLFGFSEQNLGVVITIAALFGAISASMARKRIRAFRDLGVSILAGMVSIGLLIEFVASPPKDLPYKGEGLVLVILFAAAFIGGALVNFRRVRELPRIGIGLLGAIDLVLFASSPDVLNNAAVADRAPVVLILILLIGFLGFMGSAAPDLVFILCSVATLVEKVGLDVYKWFLSEGHSTIDTLPILIIAGCLAGAFIVALAEGAGRALRDILL